MIIKGSQRGSGQNLATHLLRTDDNEHLRIHELRGFASDTLHGAFKEAEAVSRGTKCIQYLFSVSLNPPPEEGVAVPVFEDAIERIEERLGLEGQPRAVVFHEKENRIHAHCVWSRIDADTMTAKHLSFFKTKLFELARELYLEHGWEMPRGMASKGERDPANFSLAEWQQAKRQGVDPRWLKKSIQDCWAASDDGRSFQHSMEEHGFLLAKGDRRVHVIVDHTGEVYSLPRMLGVKTKDVRVRLGEADQLRSVETARKEIGEKMSPTIRRHIEASRERFRARSGKLGAYKEEMTRLHRKARTKLDDTQKREWDEETRRRASRLPKGLRGLWHRLTGKYQTVRKLNELAANATRERHERERQELIDRQRGQRTVLQKRFKELRKKQAGQLLELREDIGRYLRFSKGRDGTVRARDASLGLKLTR